MNSVAPTTASHVSGTDVDSQKTSRRDDAGRSPSIGYASVDSFDVEHGRIRITRRRHEQFTDKIEQIRRESLSGRETKTHELSGVVTLHALPCKGVNQVYANGTLLGYVSRESVPMLEALNELLARSGPATIRFDTRAVVLHNPYKEGTTERDVGVSKMQFVGSDPREPRRPGRVVR